MTALTPTTARRWAAAAVAALALTACGSGGDDPTVAGPPAAAPTCPTQAETIPAPEGVGVDLDVRPKVPANTAAVPTAVQVADIVEGDGREAVAGSTVAVKYVGARDKTGKEFDASWDIAPDHTLEPPFQVCGAGVVPGFSVAPVGMKEGGRRLVRIPDAFGYTGGNPAIGVEAGDAITFVIDLVRVQ